MKRALILAGLVALALLGLPAAPASAHDHYDRGRYDDRYSYGHSGRDYHDGGFGSYYNNHYSNGSYYRGSGGYGYGFSREWDHKAEDRAREARHRWEDRNGFGSEWRHRAEDREAERRHRYQDGRW